MGKVYHEECPHCGEELEIVAPKKGKKNFSYTCSYCKHTFMVDRDEEDVVRTATNAEKGLRAFLWAIVAVVVIWSLYGAYMTAQVNTETPDKLVFDVTFPAQVYVDGGYVGVIDNGMVKVKAATCEPALVKVVYEDFVWEQSVDPCKVIRIDEAYAQHIFT